ncbi:TPA: hypothetical protein N0F65_001431 [Lagenidium giganteum]|uniref:Lysosomal dipeptide transporter MFSD1 n=1 Tax=Lagenidium giganteum TaxID=4803 RepID=A0AAV2Z0L8_9STRA|nr:TPA: hypothetical protein N0F65_001431 [Lagenidium giganteum]
MDAMDTAAERLITGEKPVLWHNPSLKYIVLVLCSVLAMGSNYCFHNPAALKNQLQQHFSADMSKDEYETLYSTPNIVLPFVGGVLVDKLGAQHMLLVLTALAVIGQAIVALGCSLVDFRIMLVGRIVYGFGGESLGVARTTFISSWFKQEELALALGISNSFSGLASILNNLISPTLADRFGVSTALWFGAIVCAGSLLATVVLVPVDRQARLANPSQLPNGQPKLMKRKSSIRLSDFRHFGGLNDSVPFWLILAGCISIWGSIIPFQTVAGTLLLERDYFRKPPADCRRCGEGHYASYTDCHEVVPSCPPVPPYAWPLPKLSGSCEIKRAIDQLYCSATPPYIADSEINCDDQRWKNGVATQLYCKKKIVAEKEASRVMSVPFVISLAASPIFGFAVDHMGDRVVLAIVAAATVVITQLAIAFTSLSMWPILIAQGLASCLFFSALWPSIPLIVEEHHIGSAYGAIIGMGNLGLAVLPMAVAAVFRLYERYLPEVQVLLCVIAFTVSVLAPSRPKLNDEDY